MKEFTIKKLAEVEAFLGLGAQLRERAGANFSTTQQLVGDELHRLPAAIGDHVAMPSEFQQLFTTKRTKTSNKLQAMMELYIGDEWDNPVEVLEWLSFYAGAGAAHAALAHAALGDSDQVLTTINQQFSNLLESVKNALAIIGAQRATD